MAVDNELYNGPGDIWWDDAQPLSAIRTGLNPARLEYFNTTFAARAVTPVGAHVVDIGCGGGLLAEELAGMGATVVGVDPSPASLATARAHAARSGLDITYLAGSGESLPLADDSVDIACCVDVLEHVRDLDAVIRETARVLRPGGLYLYDTLNRTLASRIVMIKLFQDWRVTACVPPDLHDWNLFIRPAELHALLQVHGLREQDTVGLSPTASAPVLLRLLLSLRRGRISPAQFGSGVRLAVSHDVRIAYAGSAVKVTDRPRGGGARG